MTLASAAGPASASTAAIPDLTVRWFGSAKALRGEGLPRPPSSVPRADGGSLRAVVQFPFRVWQQEAGFDRVYGFHCLRHSAISSVYRMIHDLYLAQRFARHVSPLTTTVYTHSSDQEMAGRVRGLDC